MKLKELTLGDNDAQALSFGQFTAFSSMLGLWQMADGLTWCTRLKAEAQAPAMTGVNPADRAKLGKREQTKGRVGKAPLEAKPGSHHDVQSAKQQSHL